MGYTAASALISHFDEIEEFPKSSVVKKRTTGEVNPQRYYYYITELIGAHEGCWRRGGNFLKFRVSHERRSETMGTKFKFKSCASKYIY